MTAIKSAVIAAAVSAALFMPPALFASERTFQRDYTYRASEADSKLSSRAIAMEQVKRFLLEELGTYMKSETVLENAALTKDEITTLTAGVVKTNVVKEKWDGYTYYIKVEIVADPDSIAEAVKTLSEDKGESAELMESKAQAEAALKEVERLRKELEAARAAPAGGGPEQKQTAELEKQYRGKANKIAAYNIWEEGYALLEHKEYGPAIDRFTKALELNPKLGRAYSTRGKAYNKLKMYENALEDFNRAVKMRPRHGGSYMGRYYANKKLGNKKQSRADLKKAADLGHWKAKRILEKGRRPW
jgi:tetratricopeptide (TPR) repeat protein